MFLTQGFTLKMEDITNSSNREQGSINSILTNDLRALHRTHSVLDYIKKHPNSTPYEMSAKLNISYPSVARSIKDLEYCKLILIRVKIGSNNRTHKECFIPETNHPLNSGLITSPEEVGDKINEVDNNES